MIEKKGNKRAVLASVFFLLGMSGLLSGCRAGGASEHAKEVTEPEEARI